LLPMTQLPRRALLKHHALLLSPLLHRLLQRLQLRLCVPLAHLRRHLLLMLLLVQYLWSHRSERDAHRRSSPPPSPYLLLLTCGSTLLDDGSAAPYDATAGVERDKPTSALLLCVACMDPNRNFEDGVNGGEHADDVAAFEYAAPTPAWLVLLKSAPELPASDIDAATPPCMFPALTTGYDI
jgi:hypothetical protein